jgi:hypothetical protein
MSNCSRSLDHAAPQAHNPCNLSEAVGKAGVQSGGRGEGGVFWAKDHQPLTTEADSKCRGQGTVVCCAAV